VTASHHRGEDIDVAKTIDDIELEIRQQVVYLTERARSLREEQERIKDELPRLEQALRHLTSALAPEVAGAAREAARSVRAERRREKAAEKAAAPYGYKADGTPYKRRPPKTGDRRRGKRSVASRTREAGSATLRVTSSLHPTERELDGREVAHTTEAPVG